MASANAEEKSAAREGDDMIEDAKAMQPSILPDLPSSLASLSPSEYDKVGKAATFKLDVQILPCLVIMFIMNFLDRQNIASARLAGIEEDLNMNEVQYQTCVSILFVGYILMQASLYATPIMPSSH